MVGSDEEIFFLAAGVAVAFETHDGENAVRAEKTHQGIFSKNRTIAAGRTWDKVKKTHWDSGSVWRETVLGPTIYGYDGHGNVRFLSSTAGTVTDTYTYDAFGMPIASTGTTANNFRYSGEWLDPNLSFYNLRARYYNQATGRFETMDPGKQACCALRASQVGNIFDPRTLHKYVYAANNPVNVSDPTGRDIGEEGYADSLIAEVRPVIHEATKSELYEFCRGVAVIWTAENPNFTPDELTLYYAACVATLGGEW